MHLSRLKRSLVPGSSGDTLVEVLICIAIVSAILGGAFAVSRTSRIGVRDSQEHTEALQILQGEIDNVRAISSDSASPIYGPNLFCVDSTGTVRPFTFATLPPINSDNFAAYPSQCQKWNNFYNIAGYYDSTTGIFNFSARWLALNGGRDEVTLVYRINPGLASSVVTPPTFNSCEDPVLETLPFYYRFFDPDLPLTDNVIGSDGKPYTPPSFHVWYHHNPFKPFIHPISINPYTPSPLIPAGTYNYWASAKDDSQNAGPGTGNRSVQYILRTSGGAFATMTGFTDPVLKKQAVSGKWESFVSGTLVIPNGMSVGQIIINHNGDNPSLNDDSVDGGCLALQPKS